MENFTDVFSLKRDVLCFNSMFDMVDIIKIKYVFIAIQISSVIQSVSQSVIVSGKLKY